MRRTHVDPTRRALLGLASLAAASTFVRGLAAAEDRPAQPRAIQRCIVLWMNGGPSQLETFDPKPTSRNAGTFRDRATSAPGVRVSELLPQVAEQMHHVALVRGLVGTEGNHDRARYLAHTGHAQNPSVDAPSLGAWVAKRRPADGLRLPSFVSLGGPSAGAGFFGAPFDPWIVERPGELPDDVEPLVPLPAQRQRRRVDLLARLDAGFAARHADPAAAARIALRDRALSLAEAPEIRAFELEEEPVALRRAYGDTTFGRGCLVARRLVEAGVPFVEVTQDGWDTHDDGFDRTKRLAGELDPAMATLLADLSKRGMLESTLVVWMGEFGRTPRINGRDGRDHHPSAFTAALAGGGVRGGLVHGETDADAARVVRDPVSVPDLVATIAWRLGVDPGLVEWSPAGRPISPAEGGTPIRSLFVA